MVAAFEGWNDAADAASTAASHVARTYDATRFASLDPEDFYDFTETRPRVTLEDGVTRRIQWPANDWSAARLPDAVHDLVVFTGVEPQLKWRSFCEAFIDVARTLRVEMVLTLGALLADVAHTRPVRVTGTAADPELVARLHLQRSRYQGPTGIVGVLGDALTSDGIPSASLWAAVPHYVGQTPSPKAALALIERTSALIGVPISAVDLEIASAAYERQVTELVERDPDVAEYVSQLEQDSDDGDDERDDEALSSAESLAEEVERFLKEHGSSGG